MAYNSWYLLGWFFHKVENLFYRYNTSNYANFAQYRWREKNSPSSLGISQNRKIIPCWLFEVTCWKKDFNQVKFA